MARKRIRFRDIATFLAKTRFTMGSAGNEVPSFHGRFDDDPRVVSVDLVRKNLALGIPGFVEGTITARADLDDADADSLIRDISAHIAALSDSDAEIHPIAVQFGEVSVKATGDEETDGESLPAFHLARGDGDVVNASVFNKKNRRRSAAAGSDTPTFSCFLTIEDPQGIRSVYRRWVENLRSRAWLKVQDRNGLFSFEGTSDAVPENAFDVLEELDRRFMVRSVASRSGNLNVTVAGEEDIVAAKQAADLILEPGRTITVNGGRLFIDVPDCTEAGVALFRDLELVVDVRRAAVYKASPELKGRRFAVDVTDIDEALTVATVLDGSSTAQQFGRVDVSVIGQDGKKRMVRAVPGRLHTWTEAMKVLDSAMNAERIDLDPRHVAIDLPEIPSDAEMRAAARVLKPLLGPNGRVAIRPGSVAPFSFDGSRPDKKSALQPKFRRAGEVFADEWKSLPG